MNLREWLFKNRMRIIFFAALMKVDRSYVHRWMKGECVPSAKLMSKIKEISMDEICKPEDLIDAPIIRKKEKT